jgi:hypothetical protein
MITWVRTAEIRDGKRLEAVQWALKTAAYVNNAFDLNITVQSNVSGQLNQLHWVGTYESMAGYDEAASKIFEDAGYQQLAREAVDQELYFGSSITDSFYRTIG